MVVLKRAHGAEAAGVSSREFGAQKEHLRRIVYLYQHNDERACRSVCIGKTRRAEIHAQVPPSQKSAIAERFEFAPSLFLFIHATRVRGIVDQPPGARRPKSLA